jgi:hypothetical protein
MLHAFHSLSSVSPPLALCSVTSPSAPAPQALYERGTLSVGTGTDFHAHLLLSSIVPNITSDQLYVAFSAWDKTVQFEVRCTTALSRAVNHQ